MSRPHRDPPDSSAPQEALAALGPIGFVGAGAAGGALARALAARGGQVAVVAGRQRAGADAVAASIPGCRAVDDPAEVLARAAIIVLAVPDDTIVSLDATLAWGAHHTVAHLSGAHGIESLNNAHAAGAGVAALHPLMLFPRPAPDAATVLARLAGCAWALETSGVEAAARMETLVAALGGHVIHIDGAARVPYHLAAVLASNYVVALVGAAVGLWGRFGVDTDTALAALLPLIRASVESLDRLGPVSALTGPVARGDIGTVAAHLAWLADHAGEAPAPKMADRAVPLNLAALGDAYRALGRLAIPLAHARGALDDATAQALDELLRAVPGETTREA